MLYSKSSDIFLFEKFFSIFSHKTLLEIVGKYELTSFNQQIKVPSYMIFQYY